MPFHYFIPCSYEKYKVVLNQRFRCNRDTGNRQALHFHVKGFGDKVKGNKSSEGTLEETDSAHLAQRRTAVKEVLAMDVPEE